MLIKLIDEWRQAAQQLRATEDGAVSAPELGRSSRPKQRRTNKPVVGSPARPLMAPDPARRSSSPIRASHPTRRASGRSFVARRPHAEPWNQAPG
jgi:hypothetical protein